MSEICLNITIKSPERRHSRRSGVFTVNLENISYLFLVSLCLFEQLIVSWVNFAT